MAWCSSTYCARQEADSCTWKQMRFRPPMVYPPPPVNWKSFMDHELDGPSSASAGGLLAFAAQVSLAMELLPVRALPPACIAVAADAPAAPRARERHLHSSSK